MGDSPADEQGRGKHLHRLHIGMCCLTMSSLDPLLAAAPSALLLVGLKGSDTGEA